MAKTVSQKRFIKGVNAATGILSQQPGALTRMSNLLLTQRGSLQVCDGSQNITPHFSTSPFNLIEWIDGFTDYSQGQYPYYSILAQLSQPFIADVTNFTATQVGSSGANPIGAYTFAIVAIGSASGYDHTTIRGFTAANGFLASSAFSGVNFTWTPVAGVYGYQIYYVPNARYPFGTFGAVLLATVTGDATTSYSFSGAIPATPVIASPLANTTAYLSVWVGSMGIWPGHPTQPELNLNAVAGIQFPCVLPQPATLMPGAPGFGVNSTLPSFSPYGGVTGLAQAVPLSLEFAAQEILVLGNGLPPMTYDPATASTPTALQNSFQALYPTWQSGVSWVSGDNLSAASGLTNYLFTATQGGVSGTSTPSWNFTTGATTVDGSVTWNCTGPIAASVAPRGAAHAVVYAGSLWLANTSPSTTSDGIDGPTCLKMSDSNNPNSWNPVNTAFLGRDDGSQLTGLAPFTIAALGISPTGSMAVFKEFQTYQIIGVFGANNFEIIPAQTDMGCLAARSIQFMPGFGITRWSHNGFAVYDGVNDRLISEEIRPYLFGGAGINSDITPIDPAYAYLSKSAQSTAPPMYMCAMPLLGSNGLLTRLFCYDMVAKAWIIIDLPWPISALNRIKSGEGDPLVLAGTDTGTMQRLQSGDQTWDSFGTATEINWAFTSPDVFGEGSSQRVFYREMVMRGWATPAQAATITATPVLDGATLPPMAANLTPQDASSGQFELVFKLWLSGQTCHIAFAGQGQIVIDSVDWSIEPKSTGARRVIS